MRLPWTLQHWLKYRRSLTWDSLVRLRNALIAERRGALTFQDSLALKLKAPFSTRIRMRPASNDIYTFDEIILDCVYDSVLKAMPTANTILDLGANIGLSSLFFLSYYPGSCVVAVEPDAANFALLNENLRPMIANKRATTICAAAWARDEQVRFVPPVEPGHVNQGAVAVDSDRGTTVTGMTIPTLMTSVGDKPIDILKIDIEGGERELYRGDTAWLQRVNCIAIEFHGESRRESDFDAVMTANGFTCTDHGHTVLAVRR
ncbi:hypothetical protein BH11PLA2_BH11PLA2_44420 [soil metagenome]